MFDTDTEHHLFECCIVDRQLEWMVGEDHHDVLFAAGEPVAEKLTAVRAARARPEGYWEPAWSSCQIGRSRRGT